MLTCKYCNYETQHKQILTRHMKTKHQDQPIEKEEYKCKNCEKTFTSKASCNRHELQNVCSKNKPISDPDPESEQELVIQPTDLIAEIPEKSVENKDSMIQSLLKSPFIRWAKYIGCSLLIITLIRSKSKS